MRKALRSKRAPCMLGSGDKVLVAYGIYLSARYPDRRGLRCGFGGIVWCSWRVYLRLFVRLTLVSFRILDVSSDFCAQEVPEGSPVNIYGLYYIYRAIGIAHAHIFAAAPMGADDLLRKPLASLFSFRAWGSRSRIPSASAACRLFTSGVLLACIP